MTRDAVQVAACHQEIARAKCYIYYYIIVCKNKPAECTVYGSPA